VRWRPAQLGATIGAQVPIANIVEKDEHDVGLARLASTGWAVNIAAAATAQARLCSTVCRLIWVPLFVSQTLA